MKTIEELKAVGGFVNGGPVTRSITFKIDGTEYEATVFVRPQSLGEQERMFARLREQTGDDDPRNMAVMIATLINLGEHGEESLTVEQANTLHPALGKALLDAITEVNGGLVKN